MRLECGKPVIGNHGIEASAHRVYCITIPACAKGGKAAAATVQPLPEHLWKSLTWDQGKEMAQHARFSIDTGVDVYFCDPQSPWQRATNENTNGLLRQYFPKGTDMSKLTQADLDQAAYSLNTRPRQTPGGMTPSDKLAETLR